MNITSASTLAPGDPVAPLKYYKSTAASLTYRDLWSCCGLKHFAFAFGLKLFGSSIPLSQGVPEPVPLSEQRVSETELEADMLNAIREMISEIQPLGFHSPVYYRHPHMLISASLGCAAVCRHSGGEVFANLICVRCQGAITKVVAFVTGFEDGSFFACGNNGRSLTPPPNTGGLYLRGKSARYVFDKHEAKRKRFGWGKTVRRVGDEAALEKVLSDYEWNSHRWHVSRGAYVEMASDEIELMVRQYETSSAAEDGALQALTFELVHLLDDGSGEPKVGMPPFGGMIYPSSWFLSISSSTGLINLELCISSPLLRLELGKEYPGAFRRGTSTSAPEFLRKLNALLGEFPLHQGRETPPRECAIKLTLLDRSEESCEEPSASATKKAGLHKLHLQLVGIEGGFVLDLNPGERWAQLTPMEDLDREGAYVALAAIVQK